MSLTKEQKGVRGGIFLAMAIALLVLVSSAMINPFKYAANLALLHRLAVAMKAFGAPALCLALSIASLARERFFTPADIDGSTVTNAGTKKSRILQSILQNTLEQSVLAVMVYLFWATVMPARFLSVIPAAAILFFIGRIGFFLGYAKGAPARSTGFALTFYPTMLLLFASLVTIVCQLMIAAG